MNRSGIYRIVCMVSGKSYIGQSVNVDSRVMYHLKKLMSGTHFNKHLQSAFSLYGPDQFIAEVIELCSKDDLTIREQFWIDHYGFDNLYNMAPAAGSIAGVKFSKEACEKISKSKLGKPRSEETRAKVSIALKGRKQSEHHKNKASPPMRGKKHSEETKRKMSEAHKGKHKNGKKWSEENKAKIRKPKSDAHKQAIKDGWNKRRQNNNA